MITHQTEIRVRYADTDQMGFVYYGKYAEYLEVGRTDMVRKIGVPYTEVEERGILMPVADMYIKFLAPAHYDEVLTIHTTIAALPRSSFIFDYIVTKEDGKEALKAQVKLAFVDKKRMRPVRVPDFILEAIQNALGENHL